MKKEQITKAEQLSLFDQVNHYPEKGLIEFYGERMVIMPAKGFTTLKNNLQMKVLAMNGSIQSAKAGNHGSGFKIVSQEMSKLASKIAKLTRDYE